MSKQYTMVLNCHTTKALLVKCQKTAPRPWHVGKQGLSVLTHGEKIVVAAENSLSWSGMAWQSSHICQEGGSWILRSACTCLHNC